MPLGKAKSTPTKAKAMYGYKNDTKPKSPRVAKLKKRKVMGTRY